jgi:hypothetical protein
VTVREQVAHKRALQNPSVCSIAPYLLKGAYSVGKAPRRTDKLRGDIVPRLHTTKHPAIDKVHIDCLAHRSGDAKDDIDGLLKFRPASKVWIVIIRLQRHGAGVVAEKCNIVVEERMQ